MPIVNQHYQKSYIVVIRQIGLTGDVALGNKEVAIAACGRGEQVEKVDGGESVQVGGGEEE